MSCRFAVRAVLITMAMSAVVWAAPPTVRPWVPFGPDGGDARRIVPDPHDHAHLYLGATNGWIYQSHDSGASWTRLAQVGKRDDLVLDSIVVDAQNPKHLVVGAWVIDHPEAGLDGGLYYSYDEGATWTVQAEMRGQSVLSLAASESDPKLLVAGTLRGVFRSTDGGQRWSRISPAESKEIHNVQSVAIDPKDPNIIYAGTWHLPWKTVDGGENWSPIKDGIIEDSDVFSIIIDPEKPETVFASACSGIYKSLNGGLEFERIQNGIPKTAIRTRRLLQDPHNLNTVFAGTTRGLFKSEDSGKTWTQSTGANIIVNDVEISLDDPKRVLIATDRGGVLASDDAGASFHPSNGGFSARQVTTLKRDANHPTTLFVGVVNDKDWGGVFESDNGGQNWEQRSEGLDGRDVYALGQAPDGTMIAGTSHGLFRLDTAAQTWLRVESAPATQTNPEPAVQANLTRPPVPIGEDGIAQTPASDAPVDSPATKPAAHKAAAHKKPMTKAQLLAAKKRAAAHARTTQVKASVKPGTRTAHRTVAAKNPVPATPRIFDGSVYALATSGDTLVATTSVGVLTSVDNGNTWAMTGPEGSRDWRYLAAAKKNVIAASLHAVSISSDSGVIWVPVKAPEELTQISAVAVEPSGEIWVGGREGIFVSADGGRKWSVPKNLYLSSVNNIYYDDAANRMMITTSGNASLVFTVRLPDKAVTFADSGWSLRFARPMGDYIIAATLFDGIVVQPRLVDTPLVPARAAAVAAPAAEVAGQAVKQQ
jgi:photosystem II stability/assembly factor-like uncharacterized protein